MNIKQFSAKLNLSPTTVSRALNGYPEVSESTRSRVIAAAKKYDYRPSHHAKILADGETKSIAHIVSKGSALMIDPHFADFIAGAAEIYGERGFHVNLELIPKEQEENVYLEYLRSKKVDGFIVQAPTFDDWRIKLLKEHSTPFVVHGRNYIGEPDYGFLDVNNQSAFEQATNYLLDLGHKNIAFINGDEQLSFAQRRFDGFSLALKKAGLSAKKMLCFSDTMTEPFGYHCTMQLLNLGLSSRPTALLISSALPALGAFRAITEKRLKTPEDISIIIYDDGLSFLKASNQHNQFFTCIRSNIYEHGKQAAKQLLAQIANPSQSHEQNIWQAELVIGKTTAIAPKLY